MRYVGTVLRGVLTSIARPEFMGLVSGLVYLLAVVNFLPFAFKRHMIEATTGPKLWEKVLEAGEIENGRFLHRFPLEKVCVAVLT